MFGGFFGGAFFLEEGVVDLVDGGGEEDAFALGGVGGFDDVGGGGEAFCGGFFLVFYDVLFQSAQLQRQIPRFRKEMVILRVLLFHFL